MAVGEQALELVSHMVPADESTERKLIVNLVFEDACRLALGNEAVVMIPNREWPLDLTISKLSSNDGAMVLSHPTHPKRSHRHAHRQARACCLDASGSLEQANVLPRWTQSFEST